MERSIKVGLIGFGEVARSISEGLKENEHVLLHAFHHKGIHVPSSMKETAYSLEVELTESLQKLAEKSDVILNVTRSNAAKQTAYEILPFLTVNHLYLDLNSTNPNLMREISEKFDEKRRVFIDGVLLEPLPIKKHQASIIISGFNAEKAASLLNSIGMNVEVLDDKPGSASSFKLVKSIFMKGLSALLIETYVAAKMSGNGSDKIMESIEQSLSIPFEKLLNRFLNGTVLHAKRRILEMEDANSFAFELGMEPIMTNATINLLKKIAITNDHYQPGDWEKLDDALFHYYKEVFSQSDCS